ncbi:MAG TPA: hypothetical protein VHC19_08535 [Pirellulales bacterium]|nr:hypothetical protein [Pirellulales bacterium]
MSEVFDPYRRWLGIPQAEQPPHHYRLLGIGLFEDDPDVIEEAADRQMSHVQRHKTGKHSALSQKLLNELAAAKLCLLDKRRKAAYDEELRAQHPSAQTRAADVSADTQSSGPLHARLSRQAAILAIAATVLAIVLTGAFLLRTPGDAQIAVDVPAPDKHDVQPPQQPETTAPEAPERPPSPKESNHPDDPTTTEDAPPEPAVAPARVKTASPKVPPAPPVEFEDKPVADKSTVEKPNGPIEMPNGHGKNARSDIAAEPNATAPVKREPVPDDAALKSATQALREQMENLRAQANGPDSKLKLARRLREQAQQSDVNVPLRYVLLHEAFDAAAEAGDYAEAATAIRRLAERFEAEPTALKAEALTRINEVQESPQQKSALVDAALDLIAEAAEADDYPTAERIAQLAAAAARTLKDRDRNEQVRLRSKELAELAREYDALGDQRATLQSDPADPQANLAIGSFQCLYKSDWQGGLKRLARGSDATLKQLAQQDLAAPTDAGSRQNLAAAWRALAAECSGDAKIGFQLRAAYWLRMAQDDLAEADRVKVGRQLTEMNADPAFANRARRWLEGRVNGFRYPEEIDCAQEQRNFRLSDAFNLSAPWRLSLEFKCAAPDAAGPLLQIGGGQQVRGPLCIRVDDADKLFVEFVDLDDNSKRYALNYQMTPARRLEWRHVEIEYLPADHSIVIELDQRRVAAAICPFAPDIRRPVTVQIGVGADGRRFSGSVRRISFENQ